MEDDLLVCPYDPAHIIHPLRMPRHLLKCRKNHPTVQLAVCPFNAFHEMPAQELRYHMAHCPDKALLDRDFELYTVLRDGDGDQRQRHKGFTDVPKYNSDHRLYGSDDELWEEGPNEDLSFIHGSRQNQRPSRRRNEEESSLRLPNRDGLVARLATTSRISRGSNRNQVSSRHQDLNQDRSNNPHTCAASSTTPKVAANQGFPASLDQSSATPSSLSTSSHMRDHVGADLSTSHSSSTLLTAKGDPGIADTRSEPPGQMQAEERQQLTPKERFLLLGRGRARLSQSSSSGSQVQPPGQIVMGGRGPMLFSASGPGLVGGTVSGIATSQPERSRLLPLVQSLGRGRGLIHGGKVMRTFT